MNRTLRSIAYNLQEEEPSPSDGYEAILEETRAILSRDHSEQLAAVISDEKAGGIVRKLIAQIVDARHFHVPGLDMDQLTGRLYQDTAGLGFLEQYIHNPDIEEINGNSWDDIELVTASGVTKLGEHFASPQRAVDTVRKMTRMGGLILDNATPMVDSYLTRGTRISAVVPPCVDRSTGVVFSLRRQRMLRLTREELVEQGTATGEMLDFLSLFINSGVSLGVAGATGSGKTTFMNYLLGTVDPIKRIFIIEETAELDARRYDESGKAVNRVIQTLTRESNLHGASIDMSEFLRKSLRFDPDVLVVSEMRGGEAMIAQEAARTGHPVLTSLHANSAPKAYPRIHSMCQMSGTLLPAHILMDRIVEAFPVMAFMKRLPDGSRRITQIIEATGSWDAQPQWNPLCQYNLNPGGKGFHERLFGISDALAETLLENGADSGAVKELKNGMQPDSSVNRKGGGRR